MSINDEMVREEIQQENPEQFVPETPSGGGMSINLSFLKAPTGEGSVEDYMDEPLNFDKSKSTARILRGFTGLLGALNLAIIDIVIGMLEKVKERKTNAPVQ
jgi:hypothetical protein